MYIFNHVEVIGALSIELNRNESDRIDLVFDLLDNDAVCRVIGKKLFIRIFKQLALDLNHINVMSCILVLLL